MIAASDIVGKTKTSSALKVYTSRCVLDCEQCGALTFKVFRICSQDKQGPPSIIFQ